MKYKRARGGLEEIRINTEAQMALGKSIHLTA
jgi:hypothetical protein